MTVEQIVQEALARNVRRMADRYDISVAEARILQARLRPNPVVMAQGQYLDVLGAGFNAQTNPAGPPEFDLGVNYAVEQRGKRNARIEVAKAARAVAEMDFLNRTRQLILEVQNAAVDVQSAALTLKILRKTQQALETIVELNAARFRAGDLSQVELTRSEVAALQYQNQVIQAEGRLRAAKQRVQTLIARAVFDPRFEVAGELREDEPALKLEELQAKALTARPDLLSARRDLERAAADVNFQRHQTTGDTTIQVQFNRQWDIGIERGRALTVGILQPLPVFNRNQGEIERAAREREQAETRIRALEVEISGEVQNAYLQFTGAKNQLQLIRGRMLERARHVRDAIEYSYRRGEASFIEFLDAQRAYNETLQNEADARAEFARTLFLLESTAGPTAQNIP